MYDSINAKECDPMANPIEGLGDNALKTFENMMDTQEVATYLSLSAGTISSWRKDGYGPKFIKFGDSASGPIKYDRYEVKTWADCLNGRPRFKTLGAAQRYIDQQWIQNKEGVATNS